MRKLLLVFPKSKGRQCTHADQGQPHQQPLHNDRSLETLGGGGKDDTVKEGFVVK